MTVNLREYLKEWDPELKTVVPAKKAGKNHMVIKQDKLREAYERASDRLDRVLKIGMLATPSAPKPREVPVQSLFKDIAANLDCDGLDLQFIMEELSTSDNDGLKKAFKQFMMVAKLSVIDAMERANKARKDVQRHNDRVEEDWKLEVKRVNDRNAETQRELRLAEAAHQNTWVKLLSDLKATLEQDRVLENLHYFDQLFIECLRDKVGKSTVMIRDGKVYPNFKSLEALKSQVGEDVLKRVQKKIEHNESVLVNRWLNSAKNADMLWDYMYSQTGLDDHEMNNLMRIYLGHKKRVATVCRDGIIRDGGPWTKGTPQVVWESSPSSQYRYNTTHGIDFHGEDIWQAFDPLQRY